MLAPDLATMLKALGSNDPSGMPAGASSVFTEPGLLPGQPQSAVLGSAIPLIQGLGPAPPETVNPLAFLQAQSQFPAGSFSNLRGF